MDADSHRALRVNGILVDVAGGTLRAEDGSEIPLRPQAFALLRHLLDNPGLLIGKDELMRVVWPNVFVTDDSLVQCVRDVRRAIRDNDQSVLIAVRKRGYRLDVRDAAAPANKPAAALRRLPLLAILLGAALAVGLSISFRAPSTVTSSLPSVVVLPFETIGGDQTAARLADGLTEDIIIDLARFPEFEVVGSNSSAVYREVRAAAAQLGAAFVVQGSIRREAERVRISAQLIDAETGLHLWSNRWDRQAVDVFAIQTEIAEAVTNRLGGGAGLVQETGRNKARRKRPENLTAYELYLLGTEKLELFTKENVNEAIRLLTRAVELDNGLARAWAELFHSHLVSIGFGADRAKATLAAHHAAEMAVRLDPSDAEAHAVMGMSSTLKGDFARSKTEFDTALLLAPNAAEILIFYAGWASSFGEAERGAEMVGRAIRLEPNYPMWATGVFGSAYFMAGRYRETLVMLEGMATDNYTRERWIMRAGALAALGRLDEAQKWVAEAREVHPDLTVELMANDPSFNAPKRLRFSETMRLAGFPLCSTLDQLRTLNNNPTRLPECPPAGERGGKLVEGR
jgi:TolB-like protein/DNA-binding winged helix-turn-helix (wHTH) protein